MTAMTSSYYTTTGRETTLPLQQTNNFTMTIPHNNSIAPFAMNSTGGNVNNNNNMYNLDCMTQQVSSTTTNNMPSMIPQDIVPTPTATTEVSCDGTIRVPSGSGYRIMTPFPWRLHEMLEEIEQKNLGWIVSWLPGGRAFQVHDPDKFSEDIIPKYFRHTRYKSFQRQLYLYGFRSLEVSSLSRGAYFHPFFTRENRSLCRFIERPKSTSHNNSSANKSLSSSTSSNHSADGSSSTAPKRRRSKKTTKKTEESAPSKAPVAPSVPSPEDHSNALLALYTSLNDQTFSNQLTKCDKEPLSATSAMWSLPLNTVSEGTNTNTSRSTPSVSDIFSDSTSDRDYAMNSLDWEDMANGLNMDFDDMSTLMPSMLKHTSTSSRSTRNGLSRLEPFSADIIDLFGGSFAHTIG